MIMPPMSLHISDLFGKFELSSFENTVPHPSNAGSRINLLYDLVLLLKNIGNNLLNAGSFTFPHFNLIIFQTKLTYLLVKFHGNC